MQNTRNTQSNWLGKWARFFIDKYRVTILLLILIVVTGTLGLTQNQRQDFPEIAANYIFVQAIYPGATPEDVEQDVIIPLENKVGELEGLANIRSNAANNFGNVVLELEDVDGADEKAAQVNDMIKEVSLPQDVEASSNLLDVTGPTIAYALVNDNGYSTDKMLELTPEIVTYLQNSSDEIKEVQVMPEAELEIKISLDPALVAQMNLDKETIANIIKSYVSVLPGGKVEVDKGSDRPIGIKTPVATLEDIKNLNIGPIALKDIATVERASANEDAVTLAGFKKEDEGQWKDSVYVMIYKQGDGDVIRVAGAVEEAVNDIYEEGIIPEDVSLEKIYDTSPYVKGLISDLSQNGLIGLLVVLIVLVLFVNFRAAVVVALIIPMAFLITFAVLPLIGFSINILTLFALILSLGILVDNAIVIAEGVMANIERGMKKRDAAIKAVKDFGPAVTAATITTVIVLIPYAFFGGIVGEFLKYVPYTVITMIVASYFLAISVTPLLSRWIMKEETKEERNRRGIRRWEKMLVLPAFLKMCQCVIDKIVEGYGKMMNKILHSRRNIVLVIVLILVAFGASFAWALPKLEAEQFPSIDTEAFLVGVEFPAGTPSELKTGVYEEVADKVVDTPHFNNFFFMEGQFQVLIDEPKDRPDISSSEIVDQLNKDLAKIQKKVSKQMNKKGLNIKAKTVGYGPPSEDYDIVVEFRSNDSDKITKAVSDLENFVNDKKNIERIYNGPQEDLVPSLEVVFDKDKAAATGVDPFTASALINGQFGETDAGSVVVRDDGVSDDIKVLFNEDARDSKGDLESMTVAGATGGLAQLSEIAEIKEVEKPESVSRLDGERVGAFKIKMTEEGDSALLEQEIRDYLNEDKLKDLGLSSDGVVYGGELASLNQSFERLLIILLVAIILVYVVVVYQFNSFGQPFLILIAIPLALIGVFPGLLLVGETLNMISGLGIVALIGVVVNDAIVLIDYLNRYRKDNPGVSLADALVTTGKARFKPIFTTSITTIAGVLPVAILDPFWTGLGTAIVAGLIFSTIGTLVVVPVLAQAFSKKNNRQGLSSF